MPKARLTDRSKGEAAVGAVGRSAASEPDLAVVPAVVVAQTGLTGPT
jgi:hypothetical protein